MSVGEVKAALLAIRHDLRDAPTHVQLESAERVEALSADAIQKIAEGKQILEAVLRGTLPTYESYTNGMKEVADVAHGRIEATSKASASLYIKAALAGTAMMSQGYEAAATDAAAMRERLGAALGHLGAFAAEMEGFEELRLQRSGHESDALSGGVHATRAITGYLEEHS